MNLIKEYGIIALFVIGAMALVIFLIRKNQRDEKAFMNKLNNDYSKPREGDTQVDDYK